jgi:hypothetical protein
MGGGQKSVSGGAVPSEARAAQQGRTSRVNAVEYEGERARAHLFKNILTEFEARVQHTQQHLK